MKYPAFIGVKVKKKLSEKVENRAKELKMNVSEYLRYLIRKDIAE